MMESKTAIPSTENYLEPSFSFPNADDEVYTGNIVRTLVEDGYVYLLEHRAGYILQFDKEGNFVSRIGSPGRGPGELINPLDLAVHGNTVYTLEQGKMQVQGFGKNGEHKHAYIFHGAFMELLAAENHLIMKNYYYPSMPDFSDMPNVDDLPLFTAYNIEADSTFSIGRYPDFFERLNIRHSGSVSTIFEQKIYTVYKGFPFVQVHSLNGEIIDELYLSGEGFEDILNSYYSDPPDTFTSLFLDISVMDNGIYLSAYGDELLLYHFDFNGSLKKKIFINKPSPEDRYIRNFDIVALNQQSASELRLYATVFGGVPRTLIVDVP